MQNLALKMPGPVASADKHFTMLITSFHVRVGSLLLSCVMFQHTASGHVVSRVLYIVAWYTNSYRLQGPNGDKGNRPKERYKKEDRHAQINSAPPPSTCAWHSCAAFGFSYCFV